MRTSGSAGLAAALVSSAAFGTSGAFATGLLRAGWTPGAAVTVRVGLAALVLTLPALWLLRRSRRSLRTGAPTLLGYGVFAVAGAQLCYFHAVEHLSVAVALLLEYSGTLLVVGWMWLRRGQQPRVRTVVGAGLSIAGLAVVLDVLGDHDTNLAGVLWGLGAAVGLAVYYVVSASTEDALPPLVVAWGGLAVGAVALGLSALLGVMPYAAPRADVTLADATVSWLVPVLGLSLVAAVVAYVTGIAGARLLGARLAAFVGLAEVLFAVVFAWLLLDQRLTGTQLAGAALVVGGIALVRLDELRGPDVVTAEHVPGGPLPHPVPAEA